MSETWAAWVLGLAAARGEMSRPTGIMKLKPHIFAGVRSSPRHPGFHVSASDHQDTWAQRPRRLASSGWPSAPRGHRSNTAPHGLAGMVSK